MKRIKNYNKAKFCPVSYNQLDFFFKYYVFYYNFT